MALSKFVNHQQDVFMYLSHLDGGMCSLDSYVWCVAVSMDESVEWVFVVVVLCVIQILPLQI